MEGCKERVGLAVEQINVGGRAGQLQQPQEGLSNTFSCQGCGWLRNGQPAQASPLRCRILAEPRVSQAPQGEGLLEPGQALSFTCLSRLSGWGQTGPQGLQIKGLRQAVDQKQEFTGFSQVSHTFTHFLGAVNWFCTDSSPPACHWRGKYKK